MRLRRIFLTALGVSMLGLGTVGIFIPVLPTTPFVLIAAACFGGTPQLQQRIQNTPFFKEYFQHYKTGMGIPKKTVVVSLIFLWGMLTVSILALGKPWLTVLLFGVGVGVTIHILWVARAKNKDDREDCK